MDGDAPHARQRTLRIEIAPATIALVLGAVGAVWLVGRLSTVFQIVMVALIIVGTFAPLVRRLEHRGLRRGRALVLVFSTAAIAFIVVVILAVPPLLAQLASILADAPHVRARLVHELSGYRWSPPVVEALDGIPLEGLGKRIGTEVLNASTVMLAVAGFGVSTLFLAIYLLADPVRSKGLLYACVPREHHVKLARILAGLEQIVGGYVRGQLITSASITVFVIVVAKVIGTENALALGLFAGLTDVLPFIGGYIASTPVILAAVPRGSSAALLVALLMFAYQEFESRYLIPRVYGRELRLPPAVVVVALLVGGTLAGILGALLALPIAAGLRLVIRELRVALPGEAAAQEGERALDRRAQELYESVAAGASPEEAAAIAGELAAIVKRSEAARPASDPAATPPDRTAPPR
ncbi:MAG: AI-2E family transporter [Deltaproteobacteria bacterium]|nr:AI-2E family transporter [Deltaproteobacteria bacterium]